MGDEATTIYPIKYVVDASRPRDSQPVVVGPRTNAEESYSALAAVFNVLLLRNKFDVPSFGADSIASDTMIDLIGNFAYEFASERGDDSAVMVIFEAVPRLRNLEVEWACTHGLCGLELGEKFRIFQLLDIPLLNGTVVDPTRDDEFAAYVKDKTGDALKARLATLQDPEASANEDGAQKELSFLEAASSSYRPLTPHGYRMLQQNVKEGEHCIVAFGGRFFTLTKNNRTLYILVTDAELFDNKGVMWSRLSNQYGPEFFVQADFATRVMVEADIDDFSSDLDWRMNEATRGCMEDLQEYQVLGFDPENEGVDALEQAQRTALGPNPAGDDDAPAGGAGGAGGSTSTEDADREMALRLQAQFNNEHALGSAHGDALGQDAFERALAGALRDTGASSGGSPRAAAQSVPSRRWNIDLAVGVEVRHKHHFNRFMKIDDAPEWEMWNRGVNAIREHPNDIMQEQDLVFLDLEDPVVRDCTAMVNRSQKIVPDNMREDAVLLLSGDYIGRQEERARLQRLLEGDGSAIEDGDGGSSAAAATAGSALTEQTRNGPVDSLNKRRKKWAKAIINHTNESTYVRGSALKTAVLGSGASEEDTKGFEQVIGDLVACCALHPMIDNDGNYSVKLWRTIRQVTPGPRGEGVYLIGDRGPSIEMKESQVRYGNLGPGDGDDIPVLEGREYSVVNDNDNVDARTDEAATTAAAATVIQSVCRSKNARREYYEFRSIRIEAVITIQTLWRGHSVRRTIQHNGAATIIETFVRVVLSKRAFRAASDRRQVIERLARGYVARRRYGPTIRAGVEEWRQVQECWIPVLRRVEEAEERSNGFFSWAALKNKSYDISQAEADEDAKETNKRIDAARDRQASDDENENESVGDVGEDEARRRIDEELVNENKIYVEEECDELPSESYDNILLTASVLKWFKKADTPFKGFFLRRMRQFANGEYERSQKLRKLLRGSKHIIWECYLEQKVAQRILFTECRTKNESDGSFKKSILVWYVAKHDNVSRCMCKIDEAEGRMNRQAFVSSASHLVENGEGGVSTEGTTKDGAMILGNDTILLDPNGNTPLKIHELPPAELDKLNIKNWEPPFRLTNDERKIVQTPGTVLVLGRSGTGKTVCIVNKMVYDVYDVVHDEGKEPLKQLFVSRSPRIKNLVQGFVLDGKKGSETKCKSVFETYNRMIRECNESLEKLGQPTTVASMEFPALERKFDGFEAEFFPNVKKELKVNLSALVLWTQIRTYIKGSIESVMKGRPLTEEEYLDLGKSYCRLNQDQRKEAYAVYKKYASWLAEKKFYDSCDRTVDILNRLRAIPLEERMQTNLHWDKIYIDECQDFPSTDFALFWTLCQGGGDLFLAGDTAQSVESGISFRFEEVKRVFYEMNQGDSSGVPQSPLSIHINFRSHSGVLEVASVVLKILHDAFPGAANKLRGDEGLFKGPRPCILSRKGEKFLGLEALVELLKKNPSLVLLTPDENTEKLKNGLAELLGKNFVDDLVLLGICEAKGMDYDEVVVVNFFSSASKATAKGWKELFRQEMKENRSADLSLQENYPELEMRLKLLYTAITRCRHRLFFVETKPSDVGDSYSRWVMGTKLTEKQDIADLTLTLKSPDEWRSLGVEYAINAEEQETALEAEAWFKRAASCFRRANDTWLSAKTNNQSTVRTRTSQVFGSEWNEAKVNVPRLIADCFQEDCGFIDEAIVICERFRDQCPMGETKLKAKVDTTLEKLKVSKAAFEDG